ncbi:retrovirus-related pol polyprotein from transposon TNT 1-94 [Tanacetum coccineum]
MDAEQAFWLCISNLTSKPYDASLVKIEAPKELPKVFKDQFDSIKKTRVRSKEQSASLIDKLNLKSAENEDLKAQIQDKVFMITNCSMLDIITMAPRLLQNREAHLEYLKYTQEQADILWGIVEQAKEKQPLDKELDFAYKHAQRIQEVLVYVRDTCPNAIKLNDKKVDVTPKNKVKKVRFVEPLTSSSNSKQIESSKTSDSNTHVLSSTGLKCSTSKSGSKPTGNKRNDRISQTPSKNMKSKVEAQPRKVNKKNHVVEPICDDNIKHSKLNANYDINYATCKKSLFDDVHDKCSSKKAKIVESKNANHSKPNHTWGSTATDIPSSTFLVMTGCPDCSLLDSGTTIMQELWGMVTISWEISHDTNLYIISLDDMLKTSLIYLLSKASKTKSWLWHRRLSHLNFGTINKLAKDGLARGIPRLKFQKDHLCSAYLGKLDAKADIGIYVGYTPAKKAFRIYNKRTRKIIETIHVSFDELTTTASKKFSSRPRLQCMTPATSNSRLVPNPVSQQPCIPPNRDDWDHLFHPILDEYFTPPLIAISPVQDVAAPRPVVLADSHVSTSID